MKPLFSNVHFMKSASVMEELLPDTGAEICFAGRSNAGKSSAINAITGVAKLARTSKTPGRTQLFNFFSLGDEARLVDLPGYGYAQVPRSIKIRWQKELNRYFCERQSLVGIVLMMDIRHPLTPNDQAMLTLALSNQLPVHILLTKADKLSRSVAQNTVMKVRGELSGHQQVSVQAFSSPQLTGIEAAREQLAHWLKDVLDEGS